MTVMDELKMATKVMINPSSAFATIRDNDRHYFPRGLAVISITYGLILLYTFYLPIVWGINPQGIDRLVLSWIGLGVLSNVVFLVVIYYLGKVWGGNRHWRKVFSVILYANVAAVAMAASIVAQVYLAPISPVFNEVFQLLSFVFSVWFIVITIIGIKVIHGFGTGKAIGVGAVAFAASLVALAPVLVLLADIMSIIDLPRS